MKFLFGLAPDGVYPAFFVTKKAVCSYHAFSPLLNDADASFSGFFSVALSVRLLCPEVIWHLALWSPDFPHSLLQKSAIAKRS